MKKIKPKTHYKFVLYQIRGSDRWTPKQIEIYKKKNPNHKVKEWLAVMTKYDIRIPVIILQKNNRVNPHGIMEKVREKLRPVSKLKPGMRVIKRLSKKRAMKEARSMILRAWGPKMRKIYGSRKMGILALFQNYYGDGKEFHISTWNPK